MSKNTQKDLLNGLNEQQKAAVLHENGPLLIIAGAGSGKTRTLTRRFAYIASQDPAAAILAITFTNKAAEEMKKRARALLTPISINSADNHFIGTFHAFGASVLRALAPLAGRTNTYSIYDEDDSLDVIKQLMKERGLSQDHLSATAIRAMIGKIKNELLGPVISAKDTSIERAAEELYPAYEAALTQRNAFDFDDLIEKPIRLFEKHDDARARFRKKYMHILIDEYQDTNVAQYRLVQLLAEAHANLCVVGDDAQAIYRWRGADFRNFLTFDKDWRATKVVALEQNYRSTKNILDGAHGVIKKNKLQKPKRLWTENERGAPVFVVETRDEMDEALFIAETIAKKIDAGLAPACCAVFYRTNAQSRALEEALLTFKIPYHIIGAVKFYQRKEVKDLVAYLRLLINSRDYTSLERIVNVPRRGMSAERLRAAQYNLDKVADLALLLSRLRIASEDTPVVRIIKDLLETLDYHTYLKKQFSNPEERWENVMELMNLAYGFDKRYEPPEGLRAFLESIHLLQAGDWPPKARGGKPAASGTLRAASHTPPNVVHLMTIHASKGLEFHTVFVTGCEEGLLPHSRSFADDEELEEERRLMYVAMTRAQKELFLSFARARLLFGKKIQSAPSRFIYDIPAEATEFISMAPDGNGDAYADTPYDDEGEYIE